MIIGEYTKEKQEQLEHILEISKIEEFEKPTIDFYKFQDLLKGLQQQQAEQDYSENIPQLTTDLKSAIQKLITHIENNNIALDSNELQKNIYANFAGYIEFLDKNAPEALNEMKKFLQAPERYKEITNLIHEAINQAIKTSSPVKTRTFRAQELKLDRSKVNKAIRDRKNALYTENGLMVETGHIGKKKKPIYTPVLLNYITEELEKQGLSATIIGYLDAFDMEVLMHVESLYEARNSKVTVDMITTQMAGGRRTQATPKMKEAIYKSLLRLRLTNITINTKNEYEAGYNKQTVFSGVILPNKIEGEPIELNGKRIEEYIHILDISPLSKYADSKNQISRPPVNMLDVPVSLTLENVILKHYLARRIIDMQSHDEWRGKYIIMYDTIFEYLKIEANSPQMLRNRKNKIREAVRAILKEWIKKSIIIDFEELGKDNKPPKSHSPIEKIKITMPTFTPEIKEC